MKGPKVLTPVTYQMKNRDPWVLELQFEPFEVITEGCIYDKINYNFLS